MSAPTPGRATPAPGTPVVDAQLASALVAAQFPEWAHLPVTPVPVGGWDNRTFRLGDHLALRLPSAGRYAAAAAEEQRWLPRLAPHLPVPVPAPVAAGRPGCGYPHPWSVNAWLDGVPASSAVLEATDAAALARDLAAFLRALQRVDTAGGPPAGEGTFHRGAPVAVYAEETRRAVAHLGDDLQRVHGADPAAVAAVWQRAEASAWTPAPVWVHGDVAAGNLLLSRARGGRLCAVIDFGQSCVGDPACDTVVAWTLFDPAAREVFREGLGLDEETWARGRGWALWKALITLAAPDADPSAAAGARRTLHRVLADAAGSTGA